MKFFLNLIKNIIGVRFYNILKFFINIIIKIYSFLLACISFLYFIINFLFKKSFYKKNSKPYMFLMLHLGLGDALICNSIVRSFSKNYQVILMLKKTNSKNIKFIFRDIKDIFYFYILDNKDDVWISSQMHKNTGLLQSNILNYLKIQILLFGFYKFGFLKLSNPDFSKSFYIDANLKYDLMWKDFYIKRDFIKEEKFYNKVMLTLDKTNNDIKNKYVVVHDDPKRGFQINLSKLNNTIELKNNNINNNVEIIYIGKGRNSFGSYLIFDTLKLIENALAFHCFDSSFMWLVELMNLPVKSYLHNYMRQNKYSVKLESLKKNWIIIN